MPGRNALALLGALLAVAASPAPPAKLSAVAPIETVIRLNWKASEGAARYNVYRGGALLKTVEGTFFTDFTGADGETYSYRVSALNGDGESGLSNEASATTKPPVTGSLSAESARNGVELKWAESKSAIGYKLYRTSLYDAATFLTAGLSFIDTNVVGGRTYYYQLAPIGVSGEQAQPGPQAFAAARDGVKPVRPAGGEPSRAGALTMSAAASPKPFRGEITAGVPGEESQSYQVFLPDLNRPVRAVFIYSMVGIDQPRLTALAAGYNAMIIGFGPYKFEGRAHSTPDDGDHPILTLDYRWVTESARRVRAVLEQASNRFAHPEIQKCGVVFYGFSEGTENVDLVAAQPEFIHRLLAVIHLHAIGEDRYNPVRQMVAAPHLFLSSFGSDSASPLLDGMEEMPSVTHDAYARSLATNQGAPLTVVDHVGQKHGGDPDAPFISIWLKSVLERRGPDFDWLGTYDVVKNTHTPPWGDEQRLVNVVIAPRAEYHDSRPSIWLPDKETAEVWKSYSTLGVMPVLPRSRPDFGR